jgi:hypothetical protein
MSYRRHGQQHDLLTSQQDAVFENSIRRGGRSVPSFAARSSTITRLGVTLLPAIARRFHEFFNAHLLPQSGESRGESTIAVLDAGRHWRWRSERNREERRVGWARDAP